VPDDVLWKLKKNNGIVMVTFLNDYVNCETPGNATIVEVADHIEYIGQLIGYEHLGIGSDFDGMLMAPKGLEDVSKYPALIRELASRDITISDLKGIVGGNLLRVLKDVEHAAQRLKYLKPLEDEVKPIKFMGKSQDTKAWM
jgi:membrane dipeptidase